MSRSTVLQAATAKTTSYTLLVPTDSNWDELMIFATVSASTAPTTLKIDYQVSPDEGTNWVDHKSPVDETGSHISFTTANETRVLFVQHNPGEYARLNLVIVGTSYTIALWVEGRAKQSQGLLK